MWLTRPRDRRSTVVDNEINTTDRAIMWLHTLCKQHNKQRHMKALLGAFSKKGIITAWLNPQKMIQYRGNHEAYDNKGSCPALIITD